MAGNEVTQEQLPRKPGGIPDPCRRSNPCDEIKIASGMISLRSLAFVRDTCGGLLCSQRQVSLDIDIFPDDLRSYEDQQFGLVINIQFLAEHPVNQWQLTKERYAIDFL